MEVQAFYMVPTDIVLGGSLLLLVRNESFTFYLAFSDLSWQGHWSVLLQSHEGGNLGFPPGLFC